MRLMTPEFAVFGGPQPEFETSEENTSEPATPASCLSRTMLPEGPVYDL
jgi:hypothetical protein